MAINGEYKVFCRLCGVEKYSTEAKYRHETGWRCNRCAEEIIEHSNKDYIPTDNVFRPKTVRGPTPIVFRDGTESGKYWETIVFNWEDIDDEWENV